MIADSSVDGFIFLHRTVALHPEMNFIRNILRYFSVYVCLCDNVRTYVYMYVCMYVCMYVFEYFSFYSQNIETITPTPLYFP